MNKLRRSKIKEVGKYLSISQNIIESITDAEQDALDNFPENLQNTDRYEHIEDCVEELEGIGEDIDALVDRISNFSY